MASSSSVIWECIVCGRHLEDLHVLPCQHRSCESCLNSWLVVYIDSYRGNGGHIPCQICWSLWRIPSNGLDGLKQNYYVYVLQSQLRDITIATDDSNLTTTSLPVNNNTTLAANSNVCAIGHGNISDPQDAQNKTQFFISGHSYQNESSSAHHASPAIGTDSAMHQNDMDLDNNISSSHSGSAVIHENVISSSRVFQRNSPDGPSIGVCRRVEHYHDYDMYGAGHYYWSYDNNTTPWMRVDNSI